MKLFCSFCFGYGVSWVHRYVTGRENDIKFARWQFTGQWQPCGGCDGSGISARAKEERNKLKCAKN